MPVPAVMVHTIIPACRRIKNISSLKSQNFIVSFCLKKKKQEVCCFGFGFEYYNHAQCLSACTCHGLFLEHLVTFQHSVIVVLLASYTVYHLLTQVCPLFAAVTLREDSAKRLERRARRVSACLSDYSLASDSGVFEPLTKRLGDDHLVSSSLSTLFRALLVCTQRIYLELCLQPNAHVSASFSLWEVGP